MTLQRSLAAGDAAVLGDPTQLHQVVMNLCSNAVQAIEGDGRVSVSIDTLVLSEARLVTTCTLPRGEYVRLCIADTGSGIDPKVIDRIFDPFFTTKSVGVGTGLGLSLVHGIVTDLGGGVEVENRPGAGAAFTVYVPRQGDVEAPATIEESRGSRRRRDDHAGRRRNGTGASRRGNDGRARIRAGGLLLEHRGARIVPWRARSVRCRACPTRRCPA